MGEGVARETGSWGIKDSGAWEDKEGKSGLSIRKGQESPRAPTQLLHVSLHVTHLPFASQRHP